MAIIKIQNHEIYFERKGFGNRKILFVHGNSLSSNLFSEQFKDEQLLSNFELIRFDLPGFGQSQFSSDMSTYSFPGFAKILVEFYKQQKLNDTILVGNSLGGHVILEALSEIPGVKGLFLNGTPPFGLPPAADIFLPHPALPLFFKGELSDEEIDVLAKANLHSGDFVQQVKSELKKSDPQFRNVWMPNVQNYLPKDELEIVKSLEIPIAIIHGESDNLVNLEYIKKVPIKGLWKNEVQIIKEAGHLPFLEQADVYNQYLMSFNEDIN